MISVLIVDDHALFGRACAAGWSWSGTSPRSVRPPPPRRRSARPGRCNPIWSCWTCCYLERAAMRRSRNSRRSRRRSRVLVVSSQAAPSSVRQALSAGAAGYVPKRASDEELVDAIRQVAAGEEYVDPDLGAKLVVPDRLAALEPLSERERDILQLLALGYTNQEIGGKRFISVRTVDTHRGHIMRKLGLETRAELVLFALANGLLGPS